VRRDPAEAANEALPHVEAMLVVAHTQVFDAFRGVLEARRAGFRG
jgi:hypothetical protein